MRPVLFSALSSLLAAGCAPAEAVATWGFDPILLEPTESGVHGVASWELFSERWERGNRERFYLCGVLVEFDGVADGSCEECYLAWSVDPSVGDTDCPDSVLDQVELPLLTGVGLGTVPEDLTRDDPYPGKSRGSFVTYDDGAWLSHGWAYPASLEATGTANGSEWDGEQAFTLWPAWTVDIRNDRPATP